MSSTNVVNFSLRQNKCIERSIVFDGIRSMMQLLGTSNAVYVGFGSVWFTDFDLAHRELDIETMISLECDPVVFRRATFNRPYRTVEVIEGLSFDVLPTLLEREDLKGRSWVVWLDYDGALDETRRDELEYLVQEIPEDSFLIATFSAAGGRYGKPVDRPDRIRSLFGGATPGDIGVIDCKEDDSFMAVLAKATENFLISTALQAARRGSLLPAFSLPYRDMTPMVTVGGFLPSTESAATAKALLGGVGWRGVVGNTIAVPPLTMKEVVALRATLPNPAMVTRNDVQTIGFDLEDEQILSFVTHYLRYPIFAQIAR